MQNPAKQPRSHPLTGIATCQDKGSRYAGPCVANRKARAWHESRRPLGRDAPSLKDNAHQ